MIIATAGHVDHGKSSLVKALTGIDTDRLPEEKARGISIDLGFAHRVCADGRVLAFVDVPGHERFVRNMVAGVGAVDLALLVIAADDGIMPQTREHLAILHLLGVRRAVVVLTKIDRADEARVREVRCEVEAWLADTRYAAAPLIAVSVPTGAGIGSLCEHLEREAARGVQRDSTDCTTRRFRLAIDRVFSVAGSGTVVTGTILDGAVRAGEMLTLAPSGAGARVRQIQVHGQPAEHAQAGQRCALNLAGVDTRAVSRGDWVLDPGVDPHAYRPALALDAKVTVLASEQAALMHWSSVHVHVGTTEVTARVSIARLGIRQIAPGASAYATLLLDRPIAALHGDRFILRDNSGQRTLGGGVVLDPFAEGADGAARPAAVRSAGPGRRPNRVIRLATLQALDCGEPAQALEALSRIAGVCIDYPRFEAMMNLTPAASTAVMQRAGVVRLTDSGVFVVARSTVARLHARTMTAVRRWHHEHPRSIGCDVRVLQAASRTALPTPAFEELLQQLVAQQQLSIESGKVFLPAFDPTANRVDQRLWERVAPRLSKNRFDVPGLDLLSVRLGIACDELEDLLARKVRQGELFRVGPARFYPHRSVVALAALAVEVARHEPEGHFTVAQFRDAAAISRELALHILECLDGLGITRRFGDVRRICADPTVVLGDPAAPCLLARAKWRERHRFPTQRQ